MKNSEQPRRDTELFRQFDKIDKLHNKILKDIEEATFNFIAEYAHMLRSYSNFHEDVRYFTFSLLNCAYDVIGKDLSYKTYRMKVELLNMNTLLLKYSDQKHDDEFSRSFSSMIKSKLIDNFPALYNLTSDGFRLLEYSLAYIINSFLINFKSRLFRNSEN